MKIIVEDAEVELDLPDKDVMLKDVVAEVEDFLFEVGKIPVALSVEGCALSQEELEEREDDILEGNEVLEFGVQTIFEFIDSNLDGAAQANEALLKTIASFGEEIYSESHSDKGEQLVGELNDFFNFWFKLKTLLPDEFEQLRFDGRDFNQWFDALRTLFEEIVTAMEEQDYVLAADLLQYEVVPAIEAVHGAIPGLKTKVMARNA